MKITNKNCVNVFRKAIKALEEAKNICPHCGEIFGSNPKESNYVVYGSVLELWCKKCVKNIK